MAAWVEWLPVVPVRELRVDWLPVVSCTDTDTRYKMQGTRYQILGTKYWILDTGAQG